MFDIKILKEPCKTLPFGYINFATYRRLENSVYIRKPSKSINNYIGFSIDVINHETMHYVLCQEIDDDVSRSYDYIAYDVEDRRVCINSEFTKSLMYGKDFSMTDKKGANLESNDNIKTDEIKLNPIIELCPVMVFFGMFIGILFVFYGIVNRDISIPAIGDSILGMIILILSIYLLYVMSKVEKFKE